MGEFRWKVQTASNKTRKVTPSKILLVYKENCTVIKDKSELAKKWKLYFTK